MAKYTPEESQKIIDTYNDNLAKGIPITQELANQLSDAAVGIKDHQAKTKAALDNLKSQTLKMTGAIKDGNTGMSVYNDTVRAGGEVMGQWAQKIPVVGGAFKKATDVGTEYTIQVNKQADALFQTFQQISRSGLALGMDDTFKNLEAAGYTASEIKEYGTLLTQNSEVLANLSGTAADGAKQFADVAKAIHDDGTQTQLMQLGMNIKDVNSGTINYMKMRQLSGDTRVLTNEELKEGAVEYIKEQDRLTKLTGLNADEQNKQQERQLATQEYAAHRFQLEQKIKAGGAEGKAAETRLKKEIEMMNWAKSQGNQELADTVTIAMSDAVTTPAFKKAVLGLPTFVRDLQDSSKSAGDLKNSLAQDATKTASSMSDIATATGSASDIVGSIPGLVHMASAKTKEFNEENKKAVKQQQTQMSEHQDDATNNMVEIHQNQRDTTQSIDHVINKGVKPVTSVFKKLSDVGQQLISPVGEVAGKEGQMGGGTTMWGKMKSMVGMGAAEPATAAPASSTTPSSPTGAGPGGVTAPTTPPPETMEIPSSPLGPKVGVSNAIGEAKSYISGLGIKAAGMAGGGMDAIKQMIIRHEGLKTRPYRDSLGLWTVGVGHLIGDGKSLPPSMDREFSKDEVMAMFEKDFAAHQAIAQNTPGWDKANEIQRGAMIDLAFNMGQWWNKFPNTAKALAAGDWANAAAGLRDSKWYQQVGSRAGEITGMIAQAGSGGGMNKNPQAATGGILSGPLGGFSATLHGTEAVIPLPDGRSIPVSGMGGGDEYTAQINELMSIKINKLQMLVASMSKNNDTSQKILQRQS